MSSLSQLLGLNENVSALGQRLSSSFSASGVTTGGHGGNNFLLHVQNNIKTGFHQLLSGATPLPLDKMEWAVWRKCFRSKFHCVYASAVRWYLLDVFPLKNGITEIRYCWSPNSEREGNE